MSKGPGRIERAIANIFDTTPEAALTVEELCERIYPGLYPGLIRPDKKHRVAVIRAGRNVTARRPEVVALRSERRGSALVFCRRDNFASYALGMTKADAWWSYQSETEQRQRAVKMNSELSIRFGWVREVARFLAERDGDTETVARIDAAEQQILKAYGLA